MTWGNTYLSHWNSSDPTPLHWCKFSGKLRCHDRIRLIRNLVEEMAYKIEKTEGEGEGLNFRLRWGWYPWWNVEKRKILGAAKFVGLPEPKLPSSGPGTVSVCYCLEKHRLSRVSRHLGSRISMIVSCIRSYKQPGVGLWHSLWYNVIGLFWLVTRSLESSKLNTPGRQQESRRPNTSFFSQVPQLPIPASQDIFSNK